MNYTKGDWKVTTHSPLSNLVIVVKHGDQPYEHNRICQLDVCSEAEANANLIAAAPDMYEALKSISFIPDCGGDFCFLATEGTGYEVPEPEEGMGNCSYKGLCRYMAAMVYRCEQALAKAEGK